MNRPHPRRDPIAPEQKARTELVDRGNQDPGLVRTVCPLTVDGNPAPQRGDAQGLAAAQALQANPNPLEDRGISPLQAIANLPRSFVDLIDDDPPIDDEYDAPGRDRRPCGHGEYRRIEHGGLAGAGREIDDLRPYAPDRAPASSVAAATETARIHEHPGKRQRSPGVVSSPASGDSMHPFGPPSGLLTGAAPAVFQRFGHRRRTHQTQSEEPSCAEHQRTRYGALEGHRSVDELTAHRLTGSAVLTECGETDCRADALEKRIQGDLQGHWLRQPDVPTGRRHRRLGRRPGLGPRRRGAPAESAGDAGATQWGWRKPIGERLCAKRLDEGRAAWRGQAAGEDGPPLAPQG